MGNAEVFLKELMENTRELKMSSIEKMRTWDGSELMYSSGQRDAYNNIYNIISNYFNKNKR